MLHTSTKLPKIKTFAGVVKPVTTAPNIPIKISSLSLGVANLY